MKKLTIFLLFSILIQKAQQCGTGCKTCDQNIKCFECFQQFELDTKSGLCLSKNCFENLYFQQKNIDLIGQCQSICDEGFIKNQQTNTCEKLENCSQTYNLQTGISADEDIKQIIPFESNKCLILYQNKINIIEQINGRFIQSIPIKISYNSVQVFEKEIYFILQDNSIEKWVVDTYQNIPFTFKADGKIDQNTSIVQYNNKYGLLVTQDKKYQKIFIRILIDRVSKSFVQFNSNIELLYTSGQLIKVYNDIVFISSSTGVSMKQLVVDSQNQLKLQNYTDQEMCQNLNKEEILSIIFIASQSKYLLIFKKLKSYAVINQTTCIQIFLTDIPSKLYQQVFNQSNYIVLQLINQLQILDDNLNKILDFKDLNNKLVDSILICIKDQYLILSILNDKAQIKFYIFDKITQIFNLILTQQLNISSATKLQIISNNQNEQNINQIQLIVFAKSIQSVTFKVLDIKNIVILDTYILKDFQRKNLDMTSTINAISINSKLNILTECSKDGRIMLWDTSLILQPKILDSTVIPNYVQCLSLKQISQYNSLILFQNGIIAYDALRSKVLKTWNYTNSQSKQINRFIYNIEDYSFLIYDSCIQVINSQLEEILKDCSVVFDDIIKNIFIDQSYYMVIQKQKQLYVYFIELTSPVKSLKEIQNYQSAVNITFYNIRNFSQEYQTEKNILFEINVYFVDQSFIIFDQKLQIIHKQSKIPLSSVLDISYVVSDSYDTLYAILGSSSQKSAPTKFQIYVVFKGQDKQYLAFQLNSGNYILPITKSVNSLTGVSEYIIKTHQAVSGLTATTSFYWSILKTDNIMVEIFLSQGVIMNLYNLIKQGQFYIFGDTRGLTTINLTKSKFYSKVLDLPQNELNNQDYIKEVQQSLVLKKYFVINSNIKVYNLFTNIQEDTIVISPTLTSIKYFQILEQVQIIVCVKDNIIFLKNYLNNQPKQFNNTSAVNGIIIKNDNIIVYGSSIVLLTFDLNVLQSQTQNLDSSIVQQCITNPSSLICKTASSAVILYDILTLEYLKQIQPYQSDQPFQLQIDLDQERIFIFYQNLEVYSYSGILIQYIQLINEKIISLFVYDFDIALTFLPYVYIFDRKTLINKGNLYSPGGGQIVKIGYIKELNQLVLYTTNIRFGSIFTYNLSNLSSVMQYRPAYPQNEHSSAASFSFDKDQNFFLFLDVVGNFQLIDYQGQFVLNHLAKIIEYNLSSNLQILGFSLDFRNNNLLIYSSSQVFHLCYGDLSNSQIRFQQSKKNLFAEIIETSDLQDQLEFQTNIFIVAGDIGLLYKYYNTKFQYFDQLSEEILSLQFISHQKILVIALSQTFIIYKNIDRNSIINKSGQYNVKEVINISDRFSRFLCEDIFQFKNQTIYHYDFANNLYLKSIQFEDSNLRITKYICSAFKTSLILGLNNGSIIIYDKKQLKQTDISLFELQQGEQYSNLEIGHLIETSKDIWVCFSNTKGIFKIQKGQNSSKQMLKFDDVKKFKDFDQISANIFNVDEINNRLFLNFAGEKLIRIYNIEVDQVAFLTYLSLPNKIYSRLEITKMHLLVYSGFHVMIYDRISLSYIQRIRRQNNLDTITEIFEIGNKYILLFFNNKYEMFSIEEQQQESTLMDQVVLADPILIKYTVSGGESSIQNNNTNVILQVIIFTKNSVFEQRYSLKYEAINTENKKCSMNVEVNSFLEMTQSMNSIKLLSLPDSTSRYVNKVSDSSLNNFWMIMLKNENLTTINFKDTQNSLMQVYSVKQSPLQTNLQINQQLEIGLNSFLMFTKLEVNIRDFYFDFKINSGDIEFWKGSQYVNFHNIQIIKQTLNMISFQFKNLKSVILNQIFLSELERENNNEDNISQKSFLYFENCEEVYIYNLTLNNENSRKSIFKQLIYAKNVNKLVIKNLQIIQSSVSNLIQLIQVQQLIIQTVEVVNCDVNQQNLNSINGNYIFQMVGVQNSQLNDLKMLNNINLSFIFTDMEYKDNKKSIRYFDDEISIQNIQILNNKIKFSNKQPIMSIKNSLVNLNSVKYQSNEGNIQISNSLNLIIQSGVFQNNYCQNGGSLAIYFCMNQIEFKNITIQNNIAFASGGAIYFENIKAQIIMESNTVKIKENKALIGGGVRLYNTQKDLQQSLQFDYQKIIVNNTGELYGNNFASFLQFVDLSLLDYQENEESENFQPLNFEIKQQNELNSSEQLSWQKVVNISNFMSGNNLKLKLQLVDPEGTILNFSNSVLKQKKYPDSVMDELLNIQFKVEAESQSQDIVISGQNVISVGQYDESSKSFIIQDTTINSKPNSTSNLQIVTIYTPSLNIARKPIHIEIKMRNCIVGEVVKVIDQNIFSCFSCPIGFYSLQDPIKDKFWIENIQNTPDSFISQSDKIECLKCPESAKTCQSKYIQLKKGYWRENDISNEILECDSQLNACDSENSENKQGCLEGYIGPICKECDTIGSVWNYRYSRSFADELKCLKCSPFNQQVAFIVLGIVALILYIMIILSINLCANISDQ